MANNQINKTNKQRANTGKKSKASAAVLAKTKKLNKRQVKTLIIAVIAIVLILALIFGVMYAVFPDKMRAAWDSIFGEKVPSSILDGDLMEIRFLDVGQGDSIIIRLPDGKNMIIDAGGEKSRDGVRAEDVILSEIKNIGITTFDYMIATHTDADHVDYLDSVLKAVQVNNVFRPAFLAESEPKKDNLALVDTNTYDNFIIAAKSEPNCKIAENIGLIELHGTNYQLTIYAPQKSEYEIKRVGEVPDAKERNRVSPLILLEYGGVTTVFTGDSESSEGGNGGEEMLLNEYGLAHKQLDCDVLKVGHHGSESSAGLTFLNIIDVEYAVISVGVDNKHGHPRQEFLDRLDGYRDKIIDDDNVGLLKTYRTDVNGSVILTVGASGGMQWNASYN